MSPLHEYDAVTPARLRAVIAVAATGGFGSAANTLGTSQSSVSRSVATVEGALGVTLFDRSTRSVRLTTVGREVVEHARIVVAELAALQTFRPTPAAEARWTIATLASVSETYFAEAFVKQRRTPARFTCIEALQSGVENAVSTGTAMVGIGDIDAISPEFSKTALWTERFHVALSTEHPLSKRSTLELDDIVDVPLVSFSRDAELRTTIDRTLASARQLRTPDYVIDRYQTAFTLISAGVGVMVVPAIVGHAVPDGVALVTIDDPTLTRTVGHFHHHDRPPPAGLLRLVTSIGETIAGTEGIVGWTAAAMS